MWKELIRIWTFSPEMPHMQNLIKYACSICLNYQRNTFFWFIVFIISGCFEEHINFVCEVESWHKICPRHERNLGSSFLCIEKWSWWGECSMSFSVLSALSLITFKCDVLYHFHVSFSIMVYLVYFSCDLLWSIASWKLCSLPSVVNVLQ